MAEVDIDAIRREAEWRGGVNAKLDAVLTRVDSIATTKDADHAAMNQRIDALESRWDRAIGAAIGIGIGAGAVGGGVGALVSSLIGG